MRKLRAVLHRIRGFFRRGDHDAEMRAELEAHLEGLTERNIAAGMTPEVARREARLAFGGVAQIAERARDERRSLWLEQLRQDLRYALRSLAKSPSFTITAVVTLALGIGVNTALFSVVNMVALRPMPVREPENLVRIAGLDARWNVMPAFSYDEYLDYRNSNRSLDGMLAFAQSKWSFEGEHAAEADPASEGRGSGIVSVELVSENYFAVLGGTIQLGRSFLPEETVVGAPPVIVLSNLFWETRLHRDPDVVGRTLLFNRRMVTVIGVAAPDFSGQMPIPPAGWLPLSAGSNLAADYAPGGRWAYELIGRLKPAVAEAQAKADFDTIAARRAVDFPGERVKTSVRLQRGLRFINISASSKGMAAVGLIIFGFALVLVIACTNVANLLLARGVARQSEIGIRLTLGASRGRIVRQLLTENLLLCGLGAVLGLALATWTLQLLLPVVISHLPLDWAMETRHLPFFQTTPDLRVLGFTALLTLGATLVAGLVPAWYASRASLIATVRNEGSVFARRLTPARLRQLLVIVQVAVSLTLLSCAGLLVRNLLVRQKAGLGYDPDAVFGVSMVPDARIADRNEAFRHVLETVRALPGVAASAMASPPPLVGVRQVRIRATGSPAAESRSRAMVSFVTNGFFDVFQISLLRGRTFRDEEQHSSAQVVVVSETLARRLWPDREAVGQTLAVSDELWSDAPPGAVESFRQCQVIGVAHDILMEALRDDRHQIYVPIPLDTWTAAPVFVRPSVVSTAALAGIVKAANAEGLDFQFGRRHTFWVEYFVLPIYALAVVSAALGLLALGMASVGLHGLMSFSVHRRVHEIGIRMALGATRERVVRLFVRQGMRLVGIGLALGLIGGTIFAILLSKVFAEAVHPFDPVALAVVTLIFTVVAVFACWLPARRATKVDPMVALRAE